MDRYDDEFREIGDMERLVGERFSRPSSLLLDREGSSGVFCDEPCCSEVESKSFNCLEYFVMLFHVKSWNFV